MESERLEQIINILSKGDTGFAELLFNRPGGKKYLESIVLIIISNLPYSAEEKEELFIAFLRGINKIDKRIKHQKRGEQILKQAFSE